MSSNDSLVQIVDDSDKIKAANAAGQDEVSPASSSTNPGPDAEGFSKASSLSLSAVSENSDSCVICSAGGAMYKCPRCERRGAVVGQVLRGGAKLALLRVHARLAKWCGSHDLVSPSHHHHRLLLAIPPSPSPSPSPLPPPSSQVQHRRVEEALRQGLGQPRPLPRRRLQGAAYRRRRTVIPPRNGAGSSSRRRRRTVTRATATHPLRWRRRALTPRRRPYI